MGTSEPQTPRPGPAQGRAGGHLHAGGQRRGVAHVGEGAARQDQREQRPLQRVRRRGQGCLGVRPRRQARGGGGHCTGNYGLAEAHPPTRVS